MKSPILLLLVALLLSSLSFAFDDEHHHFDPNEKLGTVSFPTSCAPAVQKSFERGVALLHSFAYEEANNQFQDIAQADPHCAMAYWGRAMSLFHQLWSRPTHADLKQGLSLIQKAQSLKAKTQRERDYIGALAAFYAGKGEYDDQLHAYAKGTAQLYKKKSTGPRSSGILRAIAAVFC